MTLVRTGPKYGNSFNVRAEDNVSNFGGVLLCVKEVRILMSPLLSLVISSVNCPCAGRFCFRVLRQSGLNPVAAHTSTLPFTCATFSRAVDGN